MFFFFFNDTATTEIYTLSLHDALPISRKRSGSDVRQARTSGALHHSGPRRRIRNLKSSGSPRDRKSTRLNSSHITISYAVFCLKKKKRKTNEKNQETQKNIYKYSTPL